MSLFTIADLHLSTDPKVNKPMDVFGVRWKQYTRKIEENWSKIVNEDDLVILPGDFSWAMKLEESLSDFAFLHRLPGKKILGKGNHDLWWQSMKKMNEFTSANGFDSISFLFNNFFETERYMICGSRGFWADPAADAIPDGVDFDKVVLREVGRMNASLCAAAARNAALPTPKKILMFLHFPVTFLGKSCAAFEEVLAKYGVTDCYFGHIHNVYDVPSSFTEHGITYRMVSADYLNFTPLLIDRDDAPLF